MAAISSEVTAASASKLSATQPNRFRVERRPDQLSVAGENGKE